MTLQRSTLEDCRKCVCCKCDLRGSDCIVTTQTGYAPSVRIDLRDLRMRVGATVGIDTFVAVALVEFLVELLGIVVLLAIVALLLVAFTSV